MRPWQTLGILAALALPACGARGAQSASCTKDSDCQRGGVLGRCVSDQCSYPSADCDSGWKLESGECDESQADGPGDGADEGATETSGDESEDGAGIEPEPDMANEGCGPDFGGCEQLDVLLVLDDSTSSARDEWQSVRTDETIMETFLTDLTSNHCDVHIGVVTSGEQFDIDECAEIGMLRGQERECWDGGPPYYASGDEFAGIKCAMNLPGGGDSNEQQVGALLAAVSNQDPDGCNAGFLRPEANLLVFLFTDEDDDDDSEDPDENPSRTGIPGDAFSWGTALLDAKSIGQFGLMAVYPRSGCAPFVPQDGPGDAAEGTAEEADKLNALAEAFDTIEAAERVRTVNLCDGVQAVGAAMADTGEFLDAVCNGF